MHGKIPIARLLEVAAEFDPSGGVSIGLIAWELSTDQHAVVPAWVQAHELGLLAPAGHDPVNDEPMSRLTSAGWQAVGDPRG